MFLAPIHETLDTKFLKLDESMDSKENVKRRFYVRALLFSFNTFVTAAFPFHGGLCEHVWIIYAHTYNLWDPKYDFSQGN